MRRVQILSLSPLLLLASCLLNPTETMPLKGATPSSVMVLWPTNSSGRPIVDLVSLASGADDAVRAREYRVLPLRVGFDLASNHGLVAGQPLDRAALHQLSVATGIDAVLVIDVESWNVEGEPPQRASWGVTWSLLSTRGGAELWTYRDEGEWIRRQPPRLDPTRSFDEEPEVLPIGALRGEGFRTQAELVAALHRRAMQRLPELE